MRQFRHDYTNHLQRIYSLLHMREYEEAAQYIESLQTQMPRTRNIFYTGNKLANAILSDKAFSLPERVHIEFQGAIPPDIDNADLCVLLTNSLDNAAEACLQREEKSTISVSARKKAATSSLTFLYFRGVRNSTK